MPREGKRKRPPQALSPPGPGGQELPRRQGPKKRLFLAEEAELGSQSGEAAKWQGLASPRQNEVPLAPEVAVEPEEEETVLHMMLLDMEVEDGEAAVGETTPGRPPRILLYGVTEAGTSACCHVSDFFPYFWFPAPILTDVTQQQQPLQECHLALIAEALSQNLAISRRRSEKAVAGIELARRTPLMFYRPNAPFAFLRVSMWRAKDVGAAAQELESLADRRQLAESGLMWHDRTPYEEGIKLAMRFLCDTCLAGGAWVEARGATPVPQPRRVSCCQQEVSVTSWRKVTGCTPDATHNMELHPPGEETRHGGDLTPAKISEAVISAVQADDVGEDATTGNSSIADVDILHDTAEVAGKDASEVGRAENDNREGYGVPGTNGDHWDATRWQALPPLKILTMHVLTAGGGRILGKGRWAASLNPNFEGAGAAGRRGRPGQRAAAVGKKHTREDVEAPAGGTAQAEDTARQMLGGGASVATRDPVLLISNLVAAPGGGAVVFLHGGGNGGGSAAPPGVAVRVYRSEAEMLRAWAAWLAAECDPDILCTFQLEDSLRYLVQRFQALKLGDLLISRRPARPTSVKSVVSYGKQWVRQQARMTATSNQEVFRADVAGRFVIDVLRSILVAHNLSTFTLAECSQVFLGQHKEVLSGASIAAMWATGSLGGVPRLVLYSLNEARVAEKLLRKLQVVTETIELARATGLSLTEVLYKAQMIRVQSLLLRSARREGWLLGGPTMGGQLLESPYLLHPREQRTAGMYSDPVAVLDFSSLYPSLFMAHNLCYSTLLHDAQDSEGLPAGAVTVSPTGAQFVTPAVRAGVLPRICGALIAARKGARDRMAAGRCSAAEMAVLDGRQKALKLCSNALYGFTGAAASPQQAQPLADSCLSLGAAACRRAREIVEQTFDSARVIYAQTDSLFVLFQGARVPEAVDLGHRASEIVSEAFERPMALKFERVLCPFLLLQVNRYAGCQTLPSPTPGAGGRKVLFAKGVEVERRDVPALVRSVVKAALQKILLEDDVAGALASCRAAIRRLMAGQCSRSELVMTGGLWRVDDADITRVAATGPGSSRAPRPTEPGGGTPAATAEEGRGPHVALAVRLKRRDPSRRFRIGERIPYVLLSNCSKLQDEMSEDPLEALLEDLNPNTSVYLENKLRKPLEAILEHVVTPAQLRELFTGSHTVPPPMTLANQGTPRGGQSLMSRFFKPKQPCLGCRCPLEDEDRALCNNCRKYGGAQRVAMELLSEQRELERRLHMAEASCRTMSHSGGRFQPVLCADTDCPSLYLRWEIPRALDALDASLKRLDQERA